MVKSVVCIVVGSGGVLILMFTGKKISDTVFVKASQSGMVDQEKIRSYFSNLHSPYVKIIFDTESQNFQTKNISKGIPFFKLKSFLAQKLKAEFTDSFANSCKLVTSDLNEKTDEYLFIGLGLDKVSQSLFNILHTISVPIVGVYSSVVEMHDIANPISNVSISFIQSIKRLIKYGGGGGSNLSSANTKAKVFTYDASSRTGTSTKKVEKVWSITVSFSEVSGLRQIISVGNTLVSVKSKAFPDQGFSEMSRSVMSEINNTINFVEKSSFQPRSKIAMSIFGSKEFISLIEAIKPDVGKINLFLMQDYIATLKVDGLSKEYNYIVPLTIAAKSNFEPCVDVEAKIVKENLNLIKFIKVSFIAALISMLAFPVVLFGFYVNYSILKKDVTSQSYVLESLQKELGLLLKSDKKVGDQVLIVSIADIYKSNSYNMQFYSSLKAVTDVLKAIDGLVFDNLSIKYYQTSKSLSISLDVKVPPSLLYDDMLSRVKSMLPDYVITTSNIDHVTGVISLNFTKSEL